MHGSTVDTLALFEAFKRSFTDEQAQALSKALKRVEESRLGELATKRDLLEIKLEIIKWLIGTATAIIGILFALLRLTAIT